MSWKESSVMGEGLRLRPGLGGRYLAKGIRGNLPIVDSVNYIALKTASEMHAFCTQNAAFWRQKRRESAAKSSILAVVGIVSRETPAWNCHPCLRYVPLPMSPGWTRQKMVGVRGFEPPTPCSRSRCATRLRYTPSQIPERL